MTHISRSKDLQRDTMSHLHCALLVQARGVAHHATKALKLGGILEGEVHQRSSRRDVAASG
jgi:hypothetical protein